MDRMMTAIISASLFEFRRTDTARRRLLLGAMAGVASCVAPLALAAPPPGRFRLVVRNPGTEKFFRENYGNATLATAFATALAQFGYVEGRNLVVVSQFSTSDAAEGESQLAEIRRSRVDAMVVLAPTAKWWQKQFPDAPIVAWGVQDPVQEGLARSFTRPGGNITGTTQGMEEVSRKHVEVLRRLVPDLKGIVFFLEGDHPPGSPWEITKRVGRDFFESAIREAGCRLMTIRESKDAVLQALPTLRAKGFQAVIYGTTPHGREEARRHADAAIRGRIATINEFTDMADWGFLASYGEQEAEFWKRVAQQLDRIFRGTKPGDIPFINPSRYHLRVNRRTAAALGLAIPPEVLVMADHVVE
jgi:putative ABC transport system substrate-binding protein